MAQKSILVTGGTGLVGAYVVGMLQERGERPVIFDVAVNERLLNAVGVDPASVETVRGDILDLPQLVSAVRDHDVGQIIHLAAFLGEEVQRRPYTGVRLNLMGTVNVLEAARLENVPRITFPSSGTVYLGSLGEGLEKIDETIPINPPSVYAATKGGSEFLGNTYAKMYGFEFVCVRYVGGLYGPSPTTMKATREQGIQDMIRAALKPRGCHHQMALRTHGDPLRQGRGQGHRSRRAEAGAQGPALPHRLQRHGYRRRYPGGVEKAVSRVPGSRFRRPAIPWPIRKTGP